jgi:hypothetical protein
MAKMTLIVFLPALFSSPADDISDETRTKFLISAIEVAEYNHELNAEEACRQWRWIYQTYTHWHAIVYLLIEIARRPWSPTVERAWVALHSRWLIPVQKNLDKNLRIWIPLRKLMYKARKHRDAELNRLRADPEAVARIEIEDQNLPLPSSSGPFPAGSSVEIFHQRWRQLVTTSDLSGDDARRPEIFGAGLGKASGHAAYQGQPSASINLTHSAVDLSSNMAPGPVYSGAAGQQNGPVWGNLSTNDMEPAISTDALSNIALDQADHPFNTPFPAVPANWSDGYTIGTGFAPWLWADFEPSLDVLPSLDVETADVDMGLNSDINWYSWVQSATNIERDARA